MKIKYQFAVSLKGTIEGRVEIFKGVNSSIQGLMSDMRDIKYCSSFDKKENAKLKSQFVGFIESNEAKSYSKTKEVFKGNKNQEMTIVVSAVEFDDSYEDSGLVEAFHSSLRKHCESKASWGLWQWINYSVDNKASPIVEVFWSNMAYVWRQVIKKHPDLKKVKSESLNDLAMKIKSLHIKEMNDDLRMREYLKDDKLRPLWYMMMGLYENLPESEMASVLYCLSDCKVK